MTPVVARYSTSETPSPVAIVQSLLRIFRTSGFLHPLLITPFLFSYVLLSPTFTCHRYCHIIIPSKNGLQMLDLISFLQGSPDGLQPKVSATSQAYMTIPRDAVRNICQEFEKLISAHRYERDSAYICCAVRNMKDLVRQNRTYAAQLRAAEDATLFNLPAHLIDFLRDHDNLYRAAFRSREEARKARASPHMNIIVQVKSRLQNIRIGFYVNIIEVTHSLEEICHLRHDPLFAEEFQECTESIQNEIMRQLNRLEQLLPNPAKDIELENVGPDHNVDDFGHSLLATATASDERDQSQRCCICLQAYTALHSAFIITQCSHIIGKPCLARWLNSTSRNANLCPHCRTPLCERRPRGPAGMDLTTLNEQRSISERLGSAIIMLGDLEKLREELFGVHLAAEYIKKAVDDLNFRLFENDVGFCLEREGMPGGRWGFRRMRWH
jgi:hypothetical protein